MRIIKIHSHNPEEFDNHISNSESIVKFFLPQCGHCEDMKHDWNNMVKKLKKRPCKKNVRIFEVNGEAIPHIKSNVVRNIEGYPTILKSSNGVYNPHTDVYNGDRSTNDMLQWSLNKLKNSLELYKTLRKKVKINGKTKKKTQRKSSTKKKRRKRKKKEKKTSKLKLN